ncbi:MAG: ketol-acid reductoisomerase [Planctomycetota bacterium]
MTTRIYYEKDADLNLLDGKTIAIIGYGAQGAAHACNIRDSGCTVVVGQREGGRGYRQAVADGFVPVSIAEAVSSADLINVLLPDEVHGEVFDAEIEPNIRDGVTMMTCHGFSFHYDLIKQSDRYKRVLVAPKGQGHMVRGEYLRDGGVPCLIALDNDDDMDALGIGLAYAAALGGTKAGVIHTTIAAETETDLFGEQAVLCGGVSALVQAGFDTLVNAGYQPELAYFECLHELKIIVDLLSTGGLTEMRDAISTTAEFGDYVAGPQIIDESVRSNMQGVLDRIRSGEFAERFVGQYKQGHVELKEYREENKQLQIEEVGARLRAMMPWLQKDDPSGE